MELSSAIHVTEVTPNLIQAQQMHDLKGLIYNIYYFFDHAGHPTSQLDFKQISGKDRKRQAYPSKLAHLRIQV